MLSRCPFKYIGWGQICDLIEMGVNGLEEAARVLSE